MIATQGTDHVRHILQRVPRDTGKRAVASCAKETPQKPIRLNIGAVSKYAGLGVMNQLVISKHDFGYR